ncbi:uncharacterized protein LOC124936618 [Impatiens glandulifera]|uniref:uncharacterized protein LOC124936618 n=1 Tax=Impatiens glandulifera TaxID=253017 RepID=UPI001FB051C5|nr:uncharacterized protein LOC124936618 [Impatiens glandulifera]
MQCCHETYGKLFYNVSTFLFMFFLFIYFASFFLAKLFFICGAPIFRRKRDEYSNDVFHREEVEEEEEKEEGQWYFHDDCMERNYVFEEEEGKIKEPSDDDFNESFGSPCSQFDEVEPKISVTISDSTSYNDDTTIHKKEKKEKGKFTRDENFLIFAPPKMETKKLVGEKDAIDIQVGQSSSSSRRSCPKWESYAMFKKYDEEMLLLDKISAQKLHQTESLRSIHSCPRSLSERITNKLALKKKDSPSNYFVDPYHELEAVYVAQICLTWEALSWYYIYFHRIRVSRRAYDPGCHGGIAQQFQQFQVLLQRYNETEPFERGRRPEIYARVRILIPQLLQVPKYGDTSNDKEGEVTFGSRVSSISFLVIMEEAIRTFMKFLEADKESHNKILSGFFKRKSRGSIDPTRLPRLKKINKWKKVKIEELTRVGSNFLRRKKEKGCEEKLEVLMAHIDLKLVSRVLRMEKLSEDQLQWCEDKISKIEVVDGNLRRDPSPLFFPSH